jgi:hypothetical protein
MEVIEPNTNINSDGYEALLNIGRNMTNQFRKLNGKLNALEKRRMLVRQKE